MKNFGADLRIIYREERGIFALMILNLLLALGVFIFSLTALNPNAAIMKIGYGDIGGYRDGSWTEFLAFPLLAVLFGVFHNFLALKIFHKRGGGMTKFFLLLSTALILGTVLVLVRLLRES